jgi:uncharacterized membrane protein
MPKVRERLAFLAPPIVVGLLMVAYVAIFGTLSLRRHQNLRTHALDLGYTDQAVWNTLHGRLFRFSTYVDAAFHLDIPIQEFKEPDVLLGYHVEPILAAIAPLYLLHDGPETLLWLQTIGIALSAIPVYLIVRHRIGARREGHGAQGTTYGSRWLPVAFVLIYLLSPSLEAANLSDFHAVALSPVFLLAAFYSLETDRPWGFAILAFLAAMCKEEIGLLVAMMGIWAMVVRRRWWWGLGAIVAGAGWFFLCVQVIMPHFSGLQGSAFLVRYGQFGDDLADMARNLVQQPDLYLDWLRRPDVVRYLRDLWLSGGGLPVLYPLTLVMALPSLAINALSSYAWMRSGGGHYSVAIVPFLIISAAYGMDWLAGQAGKYTNNKWAKGKGWMYQATGVSLVGVGLVVALLHHHQNGISPLSRRFVLEPITEHTRHAERFIERVNNLPPDVSISVGSNLYPHVGHRERVYLFPTISDAQFILLDATGPAASVGTGDQAQVVREMLDYAQFGIADSDHGFLLLERHLDQYRLSPAFYDAWVGAYRPEDASPQVRVGADFGDVLRLEGFDWTIRPVVRPELVVEITTYWQALSYLDEEYRLVFYFRDRERRLVHIQPEEQVAHWFPTWLWEPHEMVKVTLPPLPVGDLPYAGVAVLRPGAENLDSAGRVVPITSDTGWDRSLWEQDTILELVKP